MQVHILYSCYNEPCSKQLLIAKGNWDERCVHLEDNSAVVSTNSTHRIAIDAPKTPATPMMMSIAENKIFSCIDLRV